MPRRVADYLPSLGLTTPNEVATLGAYVMALGVLVLMNWLNYMPSVVRHGLDFRGVSDFETPVRMIAFPLMAACAIALAARGERLGLATMLVSIPTLYGVASVIAFGIGIFLYGF
jgi:heme/copper-type cytochrome/quinol oxidase subunit 1